MSNIVESEFSSSDLTRVYCIFCILMGNQYVHIQITLFFFNPSREFPLTKKGFPCSLRSLQHNIVWLTFSSCVQVKFNQALADHSMSDKPRLIDGIVLTKFDTIDDKVNKVPNNVLAFHSGMIGWASCQFRAPTGLFYVVPSWHLWLKCLPSSSPGRRCHIHDLHHGPAHRVCGHRADLQRPAQPQRPRCGQRPDEGLGGCMIGRIPFSFLFFSIDKYTPTTYAWTARRLLLLLPWPS